MGQFGTAANNHDTAEKVAEASFVAMRGVLDREDDGMVQRGQRDNGVALDGERVGCDERLGRFRCREGVGRRKRVRGRVGGRGSTRAAAKREWDVGRRAATLG